MKRFTISLILILALLVVSAAGASAQETPVELFRGETNGYALVVRALPEETVVGTIHFVVIPMDASTSEPVRNAAIRIVATRPAGGEAIQSPALPSPGAIVQYEGNILFDAVGTWTVRVELASQALGEAEASFPLDVNEQPLPPGAAGVWVLIALVLIFVGGVGYLTLKIRRQRARAEQPSQQASL